MNLFKKKISIPVSNETKEIDAVQLWEVRFTSLEEICENYSSITKRPQMEAFTDEASANQFAESLVSAQKILRLREDKTFPGGLKVTVTKAS